MIVPYLYLCFEIVWNILEECLLARFFVNLAHSLGNFIGEEGELQEFQEWSADDIV